MADQSATEREVALLRAQLEKERRARNAAELATQAAAAVAAQERAQRVQAEENARLATEETAQERAKRVVAVEDVILAVGGSSHIDLFNKVIDDALAELETQHGPPTAAWPPPWIEEEEDDRWRVPQQQGGGGGAAASASSVPAARAWPPPPPPLGPTTPRDHPAVDAPSSRSRTPNASSSRGGPRSSSHSSGSGGSSAASGRSSSPAALREPNETTFDCDTLLRILPWEHADAVNAPPETRSRLARVTYIVVAVLKVYERISRITEPEAPNEERQVQPLVQILLERALEILGDVLTVRNSKPTIYTQCRAVWQMTKGKIDRLGCRRRDKLRPGLTGGECPFGVEVKVWFAAMIAAMNGQTRWYQTMLTEQATTRTLTRAMITTNLTHWAFTISNEQPPPVTGAAAEGADGADPVAARWVMAECRTTRPTVVAVMLHQMVEALRPVVADLDEHDADGDAGELVELLEAADLGGGGGGAVSAVGGSGGGTTTATAAAAATTMTRSGRIVVNPNRFQHQQHALQQQHDDDDDCPDVAFSSSPTVRVKAAGCEDDATTASEKERRKDAMIKTSWLTACIAACREDDRMKAVERWLEQQQQQEHVGLLESE